MKKMLTLLIIALALMSTLIASAETLKGEALVKPWSGYWWPLNLGELVRGYQGHPAPIEKYDLYTAGYYPGMATADAQREWYDPVAPDWHGICHGWANASILESIDFRPAAANGVFLSVGDKKGLLAACHAEDQIQYEFCSQSPEAFHRYLLTYIGEAGQVIAADLDASEEFWSYPIYRYEIEVIQGGSYDQVTCSIWHADDLGFSPDFEGTVEVEKTYQYNLEKDEIGNYIIGGGSWQGTSVDDHPAVVWIPVALSPENLFIDYDTVKEIALSNDDEFEGESLVPGHHLLIVYPDESDNFSLRPKVGEVVTVNVALDPQSTLGNSARVVLKKNGEAVFDELLTRNLQEIVIESQTGNDNFQLSFVPGSENTTGASIHLYADFSAPFEHWFYGYPSAKFWLGCAGLIENSGEITVEVVGSQGLPAQLGQRGDFNKNGRLLSLINTATTADYFLDNEAMAVKISSLEPLTALVFAGDEKRFWGAVQSSHHSSNKLVIPWLTSRYNTQARGELTLAQQGSQDNLLQISYFEDDGSPYREQQLILSANSIVEYREGRYPDAVSLNGWALVEASEAGLAGAVLRSEEDFAKDQLPLLTLDREWLVPHLAVGYGWQTSVSLYNPNKTPLVVVLKCHCGAAEVQDYSVTLPPFAHQEIAVAGSLWGVDDDQLSQAWLELAADSDFTGLLSYRFGSGSLASLPLQAVSSPASRRLPHVAWDPYWWTGVALVNQAESAQEVLLTALSGDGQELETVTLTLAAKEKLSSLVGTLFSSETMPEIAALRLDQANEVAAISVYGTILGEAQISAFCW